MDPLSVSASIIGITTAAVQISRLLKIFVDGTPQVSTAARAVLMEDTGIYACLHQLQDFLLGHGESGRSRRSLILIEQVIVVFTDCVSVFSELEQILEGLKTGEQMRVIDRIKWAGKEATISRILARLQASKASLNLMLTISNCTSMDWAEASMRNLTSLVQEVLRTNINMASRLRNLEHMHPALASSASASHDNAAVSERSESRAISRTTYYRFTFEEELETSPVYKRAGLRQLRFSSASTSSNGPSWFSGLSLSDVSNVSAIALPVCPMELWNHHRYISSIGESGTAATSLDAWYNPPAKKSAFIRTAYFNGQYTNQYAQSKFTGHLVYRRFTIAAPYSPPVFMEGTIMPQSPSELERICEDASAEDQRFELEDTAVEPQSGLAELESPGKGLEKSPAKVTVEPKPEPHPDLDCQAAPQPEPLSQKPKPESTLKQKARHPKLRDSRLSLQHVSVPSKQTLHPDALEFHIQQDMSHAKLLRARSPSCSILCEEDESVFPTRPWTKPLANMGSAKRWRHEVLGRFKGITY